ncbi:radical SAM protein [bacterium]|nr:radical SAM protein [bacterium]RQV97981.1 MAG: radical SAM protein [bacterium]
MLTFGPVPSRRLGRSVGINNIPPKFCTYSCVYCQLGRTIKMEAERRVFYPSEDIQKSVGERIASAEKRGESIDYLTFVPDGEPTMDTQLGKAIERIRFAGKKIAVITNSSLIGNEMVREDLKKADWVSVKIDSVQEDIWHRINRPHRSLNLNSVLNGILSFSKEFSGRLVTETMLVRDLNDSEAHMKDVADFIKKISPEISYLSVPTRPPAEKWVGPPTEEAIIRAYHVFSSELRSVETLIGYEGNAFAFTGDVKRDLLDITAVHPMREEAVNEFLKKAGSDWSPVDQLIEQGLMVRKSFQKNIFYARKLFVSQNNQGLS